MNHPQIVPQFDWNDIDTVLLDMDGTLLDRHFDDYFWEHYVPEQYAALHGLDIAHARVELLAKYKGHEGTLAWTDLDFWSDQLGLDIPILKMEVDHLIAVHPYVPDFLRFCRALGKGVFLVTNAHSKTLDIKMNKTALAGYFDRIICAEEVGLAKEVPEFWTRLERMLGFRKERTLLGDDTEKVLISAAEYGMGYCIYVARPSSQKSIAYSSRFPSIVYFKELMALHAPPARY